MAAATGALDAFTPGYAAPEQWMPQRFGQVGPWTDVFCLALTMVEVLTNTQAITGELMAMCEQTVSATRRPTPRTLGAPVTDGVERAFARALAVDPRERTRTVTAFWSELEAALGLSPSLEGAATRAPARSLTGASEPPPSARRRDVEPPEAPAMSFELATSAPPSARSPVAPPAAPAPTPKPPAAALAPRALPAQQGTMAPLGRSDERDDAPLRDRLRVPVQLVAASIALTVADSDLHALHGRDLHAGVPPPGVDHGAAGARRGRPGVLAHLRRAVTSEGGAPSGFCTRAGEASLRTMIRFSTDPRVADSQMNAIIYYLTAFGYIDGDFDAAEKLFIRRQVKKLVEERARDALGDAVEQSQDVIERWTEHFYEAVDLVDDQIQAHLTESVAEGEDTARFLQAKLKLRCFELFRGFDEENRARLLGAVDELMHADGTVHPAEQQFRDELSALLAAPIELDDFEVISVKGPETAGHLVIGAAATLAPREIDHPFLRRSEYDYASDPAVFAQQAQDDLDLIQRFRAKLAEQRAAGAGRLAGKKDFGDFAGEAPFLDGHVYVCPPRPAEAVELLVVGDLHGCYSCLKAALMQGDFFAKVKAYRSFPAAHPRPLLVFLGDYIDRGKFSYNGILRTVMQLFLAVPDHVFVLRGNHEYYIEHNGRVLAPVRPAEAMTSLAAMASNEIFAEYMRLFEAMPNTLVFDRTLFVHAGIPREDTLAERFHGIESLNDPDIRFQMLWSDPSEAEVIPLELQKASARFPFGKRQFKSFMERLGLSTLIRGHERVVEGFRAIYDDPDGRLLSVFSAGGATNDDLPPSSNYREVTPMALTIRYQDGFEHAHPVRPRLRALQRPRAQRVLPGPPRARDDRAVGHARAAAMG